MPRVKNPKHFIAMINYIIGKNQNHNQELLDNAKPNDYWLHLSDYPSPHAIIKNPTEKRIHHKIRTFNDH